MKDLIDSVFGKWVVISYGEKDKHNKRKWLCKCCCGDEYMIGEGDLKQGKSTQCRKCSRKKEGELYWDNPLYSTYCGMKQRCNDKNSIAYKNYGGRGIKVCKRWSKRKGFDNFLKDMGNCPKGYTLDRIDVDGGYTPNNCRWANKDTQAKNKRKDIEFEGKFYKSLRELADTYNINKNTFYWRLSNGWSIEKATKL